MQPAVDTSRTNTLMGTGRGIPERMELPPSSGRRRRRRDPLMDNNENFPVLDVNAQIDTDLWIEEIQSLIPRINDDSGT